MSDAPQEDRSPPEAVKDEIRAEHGEAANAPSGAPRQEEQVQSEEFENDPARNPPGEAGKNIKGG